MRRYGLLSAALLIWGAVAVRAGEPGLTVYQDLEEATGRISRLADKPYLKLVTEGVYQPEVLIFKDLETGSEVWSLTRELCTDLANIERRSAWSCNGQYVSFIGNTAFWNYNDNQLWKRTWAGYNYIANADGSGRRKLWGSYSGRLMLHQDKFNNWDQTRPDVLYYPAGDTLWRVTLGNGEKDNQSEPIYRFPKRENKIIQEISDSNFMLIEESGRDPNCYVINLNKDPGDPLFCLTCPLKGEVHPGSFRFMRSRLQIRGGYENHALGDILMLVDPGKGRFIECPPEADPYGVEMAHLWYGLPDDRAAFSGRVRGEPFGLYVQLPGKAPVLLAEVSDGHPTWCGRDPEWFFYAVGTPSNDSPYSRRLVAGRADGSQLRIICTPFDRRRGEDEGGYDAIPRPNQSPDATKCWFHSSMLMPTNKYTGSYLAVFRRPQPPAGVEVSGQGEATTVKWTPHALSREVKGYHVYRSEDGGKSFNELTSQAVPGTEYKDRSALSGKNYIYAVTAEEWSRLESDVAAASTAGEPVKGWDKTPPAKVSEFKAERKDGLIRLAWSRSNEQDLRYYNLYASTKERPGAVQRRRLVSPPHDQSGYIDWTAPVSGPVYYALTAVDRQGNESEPVFTEAP